MQKFDPDDRRNDGRQRCIYATFSYMCVYGEWADSSLITRSMERIVAMAAIAAMQCLKRSFHFLLRAAKNEMERLITAIA